MSLLSGSLSSWLSGSGIAYASTTFSNTTAINVVDATYPNTPNASSPYPSNIAVSGLSGTITNLTVSLSGISHQYANDLDVLLVGPGGQKFTLMTDVGGFNSVSNVNLTFDDAAAAALPTSSGSLVSGTFRPTSYADGSGPDSWPSPAPAGPYSVPAPEGNQTLGTVFNGTSPNGTWSLYVDDDSAGGSGSIGGGWGLNITVGAPATTTTTVSSSTNPSTTGNSVTITAHVAKSSDASNVTVGTVTFKEGQTTLASNVALNTSGNASFTTSALSEGTHVVDAFYNGDTNFSTSNGSVTQQVDDATVVNGGSYCNTGTVALNDPQFVPNTAAATPYPSHITVSGASGAISKVTLTLKTLSEPEADDLDVLLVGPSGQKFVVVSDAGGYVAISSATVTLDDDSASVFADNTGGWSNGTTSSRPVDYNDGTDTFPSPAPSSPVTPSPTGTATFASVFGGADPNGTWSLYAVDDSASSGESGTIAGGWCLNLTTTNDPATTTTISSSANPSNAGSPVTLTAHVTKNADDSDVTAGTVTFRSDGTVIGGPTALSGAGLASVTTSTLSEGTHTITASYSGSPGAFNLSTGSFSQQTDSTTVETGSTYCNNGGIQINDPPGSGGTGTSTPYPSHISVSGAVDNLANLTVSINGLSHAVPDDVDMLLVSPTGATLKLMSDTGGFNAVSNLNLTFDDAAASPLPDSSAISSGAYKPTDYNDGTDTFPSPAPSGTYGSPAPTGSATLASFNSANPDGTWSLYVVDDTLGSAGSISGWCLTLDTDPTLSSPSAAPSSIPSNGSTASTLSLQVTPGTHPASSSISVSIDLRALGGSQTQPMADDGATANDGDAIAGDGIYSTLVTAPEGTLPQTYSFPTHVQDGEGRIASSSIPLTVTSPTGALASIVTATANGVDPTQATLDGTGAWTPGSYTATGGGGSDGDQLQVARYSANPVSAGAPSSGVGYFDVKLSPGNSFTSIEVVDCNLTLGPRTVLYWYDRTAPGWQTIATADLDTATHAGCATIAIGGATPTVGAPTLAQLVGTVFATNSGPTHAFLAGAKAIQHAGLLTVRWQVASNQGIAGFRLTAGRTQLTRHLIPVHRSRSYRYSTPYRGTQLVTLHVLFTSGKELTSAVGRAHT